MATNRQIRDCADWKSEPMNDDLAARLHKALSDKYGADKVRYAVLCVPVAVEKVIDNAADARETLRRLAESA